MSSYIRFPGGAPFRVVRVVLSRSCLHRLTVRCPSLLNNGSFRAILYSNRCETCQGGHPFNPNICGTLRSVELSRLGNGVTSVCTSTGVQRVLSLFLTKRRRRGCLRYSYAVKVAYSGVRRTETVVRRRCLGPPSLRRLTLQINAGRYALGQKFGAMFNAAMFNRVFRCHVGVTYHCLLSDDGAVRRVKTYINCRCRTRFSATFGQGFKLAPLRCEYDQLSNS